MPRAQTVTQENVHLLLVEAVPEFEPLLQEHVQDNFGEVLAHVLFGDLARFIMDGWRRNDRELVNRCLEFLERAITEGTPYVEDLVAVSFVENVGPWEEETKRFIAEWPERLKQEARRQQGGQA